MRPLNVSPVCQRNVLITARLDLSRLVRPKQRGEKTIARCPACAEDGGDRAGEHLAIFEDGKFACAKYPGDHEHRQRIFALIGTVDRLPEQLRPRRVRPVERARDLPQVPPLRRAIENRPLPTLPSLRFPTVGELAQIAEIRRWPFFAGLELAARAGQLRCADMLDAGERVAAWLLLDSSGRNAQARRLDGLPWRGIEAKAWTLRGSQAAWPIGAADIGDKPHVALCEGGPDTLAAWSLAWWNGDVARVAPVCMAGAGQRIHSDALPFFRCKGVFLVPHKDAAGERSRRVWTAQLLAAGAAWVVPYDLEGHKDLSDALTAAGAELEREWREEVAT